MTVHDPHDPERPLKYSDYERSRLSDDRYAGWGLPVMIAAVVFVGGLLIYGPPSQHMTTASNEHGGIATSTPAQTPPLPPATPQ